MQTRQCTHVALPFHCFFCSPRRMPSAERMMGLCIPCSPGSIVPMYPRYICMCALHALGHGQMTACLPMGFHHSSPLTTHHPTHRGNRNDPPFSAAGYDNTGAIEALLASEYSLGCSRASCSRASTAGRSRWLLVGRRSSAGYCTLAHGNWFSRRGE